MQAEDVAGIFVVPHVRLDVRTGRKAGKACHRHPGNGFDKGGRARAERAIGGLLLAEDVEPERAPARLSVQRLLGPGDEACLAQRDHLVADDRPLTLELGGKRKSCLVFEHDARDAFRSPCRLPYARLFNPLKIAGTPERHANVSD